MDNSDQIYSFDDMYKLNVGFKKLLQEDYNVVYFEKRAEITGTEIDNKETENQFSHLFQVPQKDDSIFSTINSPDDLEQVKSKISLFYDQFIDDFDTYFERIEDRLDEKNLESFEIIFKTLKNRKKRLDSSLKKFKIVDSWNITRIKEELQFALQKNFKDIIDSLVRSISTGLYESSAYEDILKQLNLFLSKIGIYTYNLNIGQKLTEKDWNFVEPEEGENCDTSNIELRDVIKEITTYPYIIKDGLVISEGKIILWRNI